MTFEVLFWVLQNIVQRPIFVAFVLIGSSRSSTISSLAAGLRRRGISPGSRLAFSYCVGSFGFYGETSGALAGILILMPYFYYPPVIIPVDAEINPAIEEHFSEGENEGEKTPKGSED